jgi:ABC-type glycerol-3-phosphate transport system substrate-binding protein
MIKQPHSAVFLRALALLLIAGLLLAACQTATLPAPDSGATDTGTPAHPPAGTPAPVSPTSGLTPTVTLTPTPTEVPEHMQVDPEALRGVQVTLWHPWSGEAERLLAQMVGEFNRSNVWGITALARSTGGSSELYWQVSAAVAEQSAPDVIAAPPDLLRYWDMRQMVADLADYESNPDWGLSEREQADFYPVFWQQDQAVGRQLGIPAERTTRVLFYNRSWARDLGFDQPPATPQEFEQQACAAARALAQDDTRENDGLGGWIVDRSAETVLSWMAAFGGSPAAPGGALQFNTPASADALTYLRRLFDQGCAWNSRDPLPYDYFATRRALLYSGSLDQIGAQAAALQRAKNTDEWLAIPFPSVDNAPALVMNGSSYGILRSTPERQLAGWLLIRHLMLPRNQAKLVESNLSLPVSASARELLGGLASKNTQWAAALALIPEHAQAAQVPGDWWAASGVLEDAAWQLLQITPIPAETILEEADRMVPELLEHQP